MVAEVSSYACNNFKTKTFKGAIARDKFKFWIMSCSFFLPGKSPFGISSGSHCSQAITP